MFRTKMQKSIETIQLKADQIYNKFKSYFAYQVKEFSIPAEAAREFDADPDLLCILIPIRIQPPQVFHMLENQKKFFNFVYSSVSLHCIFLFSVIGDSIFNI
jgi:hypothetical protein